MSSVRAAIEIAGGPAEVSRLLGVTVQAVCFWRDGKREFPAEHCAVLEAASKYGVRRWELRPADWHRIWPELVGADGAPPVAPAEVAQPTASA